MSFIRSGSNPEALYVYHSVGRRKCGYVSFSGHDGRRTTDTGDRYGLVISPKDFYKVCENYEKRGCEKMLKSGDFGIQEIMVETKSGKRISQELHRKRMDRWLKSMSRFHDGAKKPSTSLKDVQADEKIWVFWKGKLALAVWRLTWEYMVQNVIRYKVTPAEFRKAMKQCKRKRSIVWQRGKTVVFQD